METYIFQDSPVGLQFLDALVEAARRGVRVRLLVDAMGSTELKRDHFAPLIAAGGDQRWFNPPRWTAWSFRDHRKLVVVDEEIGFLGGCNIGPEYFGDGIEEGWRDGGIGIRGPVVEALTRAFDTQFARHDLEGFSFKHGGDKQKIECGTEVDLLLIAPGVGKNVLRDAMREDLKKAEEVFITSAYFLPTLRMRDQLAQAASPKRKGLSPAKISVLLAGKSDVRLMQLASRSLYRRMLRQGVRIFEYMPQILHAKRIVIDDVVYVGSSNLDPRSLRINFEIMIRIRDASLAREAKEQFYSDLKHSHEVLLQELSGYRGIWERIRQRFSYWILATVDPSLAKGRLQALGAVAKK